VLAIALRHSSTFLYFAMEKVVALTTLAKFF
jgi:hypothetical protein